MFKKTCCQRIKLLFGILMMIMIISKNNVRAHSREDSDESFEERNEQNIKRLARVFDDLSSDDNDDDEYSFGKRVAGLGGQTKVLKCTEIITDGYPLGSDLATLKNVPTVAECMANCDKNRACLAWIAYPPAGQCWLRSSGGKTTSATGMQGGSCIEPTKKTKCVEISSDGYYKGPEDTLVPAATSLRCSKICDENDNCMGWSYNVPMRECAVLSKTGEWVDNPNYRGGACNGIINSKCKEKLLNSAYAGDSRHLEKINTIEDCINVCESDTVCSAWSYNTATKNCYLYTSVSDVSSNADFTSGQCYRGDLRADQCEKKEGYPRGGSSTKMPDITTQEDCKKKCDQNLQCWGWAFEIATQTCSHYSTVFGFVSNNAYVGGSCYDSNSPYIDIPPLKIFQQQSLDKHNEYRRKHCAQELTLSDDLNDMSQDYATRLANFGKTPPNYSGIRMENLYYQKLDYKLDGSVPVTDWYSEIDQHNWAYPDFSKRNRFAKVIWNGVRQLGVGRAFSRDNTKMYVVATYYPGGYVEESYKDNIKQQC